MSERWRMCCTSEWVTPPWHKNKEDRKTSCSPLLPTGPHHEGAASEGDQGDPQEQHTVMKRVRASGSSPSERCLHMGWIGWISDVTAYVITVYAITVYPCTQALGGQQLGYETMPFHRQRYKATHTGYTQLSALPAQMGITKSMTKQTTNVTMLLLWKRKAGYNFHLTVHTCSAETINNKFYVCGIPHSESHMKTCKHSVIHACKHVRWHRRKPHKHSRNT